MGFRALMKKGMEFKMGKTVCMQKENTWDVRRRSREQGKVVYSLVTNQDRAGQGRQTEREAIRHGADLYSVVGGQCGVEEPSGRRCFTLGHFGAFSTSWQP